MTGEKIGAIINLLIDFIVMLAQYGLFVVGVVYATAFSNTGKVTEFYQAVLLLLLTIAIGSLRRGK